MIFFEYLFHVLRYIFGAGLFIFFIVYWHKLIGPILEYGLPKFISKGVDDGNVFASLLGYAIYLFFYMTGVVLLLYVLEAGFADLWLKIFDFYYFYDYFSKIF